MVIEVSPHIPPSPLGLRPVPQCVRLLWWFVHKRQIISVVELCELWFCSKVIFAEFISHCETCDCWALHWERDLEYTASPTVVVSSVENGKGSVLNGDVVKGSDDRLGVCKTKDGQRAVAWSVAFEGIAVIAWDAAGPIILVLWENGGLQS